MFKYQKLALDFVKRNSITNIDDITGIVIYAYILDFENKRMSKYHCESNKYCYQLTDGTIGTLPMETTNRIVKEIMNEI